MYILNEDIAFPSPYLAERGGMLAIGGDLKPERLLLAYSNGIFPWYSKGEPITWYCTQPRCVILPEWMHVPKSLRPLLNNPPWRITMDTDFESVIEACAVQNRPGQLGTWILPEIQHAFTELYHQGFAHSVEVWNEDKLIAGFYGLSLGRAFFGESMFTHEPNASKFAFAKFMTAIKKNGFELIDCQQKSDHMTRFGARMITLQEYLSRLDNALKTPSIQGKWTDMLKI